MKFLSQTQLLHVCYSILNIFFCWLLDVTECRYWIKSCIYYTLLKRRRLLLHVVKTVARTSLPHHRRNPQVSYLTNSQKTCFPAVGICKKPVCWICNVIIIRGTHDLSVTSPCSYKGPTGINTHFSIPSRARQTDEIQTRDENSEIRQWTI